MAGAGQPLSGINAAIDALPSTIERFWSAVARPLFELGLVIVVLAHALGLDKQSIAVQNPDALLMPQGATKSILEFYGVVFIVPLAAFVVLLGLAKSVYKLLRVAGEMVPGRFKADEAKLLAQRAKIEVLRAIWSRKPLVENLDVLSMAIDSDIKTASETPTRSGVLAPILDTKRRIDASADNAIFVRGLAFVTLALVLLAGLLVGHHIEYWRLLFLMVIALILVGQFEAMRIGLTNDYAAQKTVACWEYVLSPSSGAIPIVPPAWADGKIAGGKSGPIWNFHLLSWSNAASAYSEVFRAIWRARP